MMPSRVLFYFCVAFIIGIALESLIKIPAIFLWGFLMVAVACIVAGFYKKELAILGFCILFIILGIARFQISEFAITSDKVSQFNDKPEKITLIGYISAEPDVRNAFQKLKVKIKDFDSFVLVTTGRYLKYNYLDSIIITGKLKTPAVFDGFSYKDYLAKDGIYSVMDFPAIQMLSQKHDDGIFSYTYEKILWVKAKLTQSINDNFPQPDALILEGMIFGNDKNMAPELKNQFNITGLSHVTAVSGANIIILINMFMVILLALGFWRGQAFYFSIVLIWLYIIMIGFPVSGVRAALMGSVVLLAQKFGRQNTSSRVLTMTASGMLLQNPMLLVYDVSFQLSFLASLGIIYIKPLIDYYFAVVSWKNLQWLLGILSVTLAAQMITLPIIVYNFGRISLIAPVTNILALPVVEALTILGFLTSVAGAFSNMLGLILSLPCLAMLWYFMAVLDIFSAPWASMAIENVSWLWIAAYYALLFALIAFFQKLQRPKFLG